MAYFHQKKVNFNYLSTEKQNLLFLITKEWKNRGYVYFGQFELVHLDDVD